MLKKRSISGLIATIIIFLTAFYSFYSLTPHKNYEKNIDKNMFSTTKAMEHVRNMSRDYHFVGTKYHEQVKNYVIAELNKLGLQTEIQKQFSLNDKWKGATVNQNILARIKGTEPGKALMLLSHYDSAPFASRGASDDAVGVGTILEGVRAFLSTGKKPKHDIIILISDGEEIGLNGAKAFVENHLWVKDIGLVINFEARGSGGPSYTLMETNGGNEKMVKEFVKARPHYPVANSFLYSIYKKLPNDTDLTMFREIADIDGFNFAFIDDFFDYHTKNDSYDRVDINTVTQQGDYLMSLLNYFSQKDLDNIKSNEDYVFFNFPVFNMIYYPFSWVIPLFFIALFLVVLLVSLGKKYGKLKLKRALLSFFPFLIVLGISTMIAKYGWKFLLMIHPGYKDILHGFPYNGHYYIGAFVLLSILITFWTYRPYWKKMNLLEIMFAPIILWLIISGVFAYKLPGASFLIMPLYILIIVYIFELFSNLNKNIKILLYTLLAIPAILTISPFIDMFPVGLRMVALPISAFFTILLFSLVFPLLKNIYFRRELSLLTLILTILTFIMAEAESGFDKNHPKPNSINYMYYMDDDKAFWETYNTVMDEWTKNIMGDKLLKGSYGKSNFMSKYNTPVSYHSSAPKIDINLPNIEKIQDIVIDGYKNIEYIITPGKNTNRIDILVDDDVEFKNIFINRVAFFKKNIIFTSENNRILTYFFTEPGEKLDIRFLYSSDQKPELLLYQSSYNLIGNNKLGVQERTPEYIPMPFVINDAIVVVKKLKI
ncbi:MAG TPA: M20/M25/M40 family metallo-hydrolase [Bacteroidetes bacterium]|nr:M20/M25/M40 family metallo-hydrolase [Bacteroidota bacterium]